MGIFGAIPLLFTPNVTSSGIVNNHGFLVHGNTTTFSGGPQDDPELTKRFGQEIKAIVKNPTIVTTSSNNRSVIYDNVVVGNTNYISSNIQIYSLDNQLAFTYGIILNAELKSATRYLSADLNVISIENLQSYIVPTKQEEKDLLTYVRRAVREENSFDAVVDVKTTYKLFQVFTRNEFIYAATDEGLKVYNSNTNYLVAFIDYLNGFTTVCGDDERVFMGTTSSGIKYLNYSVTISGTYFSPQNLNSYLQDYSAPNITNNSIKYIHIKDVDLLVCTNSGVDYFKLKTNPTIHSKTYIAGAEKCFLTSDSLYYTVSGTNLITSEVEYKLNRMDNLLCDWTLPTEVYTTGSGIFARGLYLTDMYITENTALVGGNTIFCTTSSGVYVIDEDSKQYAVYYMR